MPLRRYHVDMLTAFRAPLLFALVTTAPGLALAQVSKEPEQLLTAVCKGPTGTTLAAGKKRVMEPDGFGDGMFTYSWKVGSNTATIISQSGSAAGSTPSTEQATAVVSTDFVNFFVFYERAVWMHTLFFGTKTVLISRHVNSAISGGPVGGVYSSSCAVALQ